MKFDRYDHVGIAVGATCLPACVIAVVLRLYARRIKSVVYGWDDFWAVAALLFFSAFLSLFIYSGSHGAGYTYTELPLPVLESFLKMSWVGSLFTPGVFVFAKTSILCFYNRIFSINRNFTIWVTVLFVLNTLWGLGTTLALAFQCQPNKRAWKPLVEGKCINPYFFMILTETPNSILDIAIMILPIGVLRKLHLKLKYKISLAMVFLLGGIVAIVGFVRIGILYQEPELVYNLSAGVAITTQQTCAIICCCLPTFGPLFKTSNWLTKFGSSVVSPFRSLISRSKFDSGRTNRSGSGFDQLNASQEIETLGLSRNEAVVTHNNGSINKGYPLDSIAVKRTVDVV